MSLKDLPHDQFTELAERTRQQYQELKARNLNLDLTRGKPSSEQLDFSNALLSLPGEGDYKDKTGADVRNYGNLQGIADIRDALQIAVVAHVGAGFVLVISLARQRQQRVREVQLLARGLSARQVQVEVAGLQLLVLLTGALRQLGELVVGEILE